MRVIFFNHYHKGDIHASRGFIRVYNGEGSECIEYIYSHRNIVVYCGDIDGSWF